MRDGIDCALAVITRESGIQYSRAFLFIITALEYWVARSSRAMTTGYESAFSRHGAPEVCKFSSAPKKIKGAGKTGCALHPRSHVQMCIKKCAHEHTGEAETLRPSLRNGFTAYFVLSLVSTLCHHRPREALASWELDASTGASGPRDFAVRISAARLATPHVHRSLPQRQ